MKLKKFLAVGMAVMLSVGSLTVGQQTKCKEKVDFLWVFNYNPCFSSSMYCTCNLQLQ